MTKDVPGCSWLMVMDVPVVTAVVAARLAEADAGVADAAAAADAVAGASSRCPHVDAAIVAPGWLQMLVVDVPS